MEMCKAPIDLVKTTAVGVSEPAYVNEFFLKARDLWTPPKPEVVLKYEKHVKDREGSLVLNMLTFAIKLEITNILSKPVVFYPTFNCENLK